VQDPTSESGYTPPVYMQPATTTQPEVPMDALEILRASMNPTLPAPGGYMRPSPVLQPSTSPVMQPSTGVMHPVNAGPMIGTAEGQNLEQALLERLTAAMTTQLASHRAAWEQEQAERERRIVQTVNSQVKGMLRTELKDTVVPALTRSIEQAVEQSMRGVPKTLAPHIEKVSREVAEKTVGRQLDGAVSKAVAQAVREPIKEGFRQNFAEQLIPAFERSVQKMFEQINGSFDAGLQQRVQAPFQSGFDELRRSLLLDVRGATKQLNEVCAEMHKSIERQHEVGQSAAESAAPPNPTQLMEQHLAAGNHDEAFRVVLSESNVELVAQLCGRLDIAIFNSRPPVITQPTLCSLVQQLGFDLENELQLKVQWLQAALLVLDTRDQVTQQMMPHILSDLAQSLAETYELHSDPTDPQHNSIKLMMHLVNSMNK